jgi:hypothetical protein
MVSVKEDRSLLGIRLRSRKRPMSEDQVTVSLLDGREAMSTGQPISVCDLDFGMVSVGIECAGLQCADGFGF